MSRPSPIVSVVLSVYNGEPYLRQAVESILHQSFRDFEFLIVDDGSTDGSDKTLASFRDDRIQIIRNEKNIGLARSLNKALERVQGTFIARMDADDFSPSDRFQKQFEYLNAHPDIAIVGSDMEEIDKAGNALRIKRFPRTPEEVRATMFVHNPLSHSAIMARTSVYRAVGGYDPQFLHTEDYDLWLRVAATYDIANLPEVLLTRRLHDRNVTEAGQTEMVRNRIKVLKHAFAEYYDEPSLYRYLVRPFAAYWYRKMKDLLQGRDHRS